MSVPADEYARQRNIPDSAEEKVVALTEEKAYSQRKNFHWQSRGISLVLLL